MKDLQLCKLQRIDLDDKFIELMYKTIEEVSGCIDCNRVVQPQCFDYNNQSFDIDEKFYRHFHAIQCNTCGVSYRTFYDKFDN